MSAAWPALVWGVLLLACGQDRQERVTPPSIPQRLRLLTDAQFANAVRDLLDVEPPEIRTPGTSRHQLVHEEVMAIDAAHLVEYRMAAGTVAQQIALAPPCDALPCVFEFAERAFRRPLDADERDRLTAVFEQGRFPLIVETVLQAPSFLYRTELGAADAQLDLHAPVELTAHELAAELAFFLSDSLPDARLRAAARDGTLTDPAVLAREVDRLLAEPRVKAHVLAVVLDWLQLHRIYEVGKDKDLYPELTDDMRTSMYGETERFVRDVLFRRDGSLRELLTSRQTFVDARLADHYDVPNVTGDEFVAVMVNWRRGGILTHASVLTALASAQRESIIMRGKYVHDSFLCTPELGRPAFDAISNVAGFTGRLSESQFAHYRTANPYCSSCHRIIDPPGRALERFDAIGRWRERDEINVVIEDDTVIEIDGAPRNVRGAAELGEALAASDQVARCAVQRFTEHAFGRELDVRSLDLLVDRFEISDRNLVELFRLIATSPAFRARRLEVP